MPVTPQSPALAVGLDPSGPGAVVLNTDPRLAEHIAVQEAGWQMTQLITAFGAVRLATARTTEGVRGLQEALEPG